MLQNWIFLRKYCFRNCDKAFENCHGRKTGTDAKGGFFPRHLKIHTSQPLISRADACLSNWLDGAISQNPSLTERVVF